MPGVYNVDQASSAENILGTHLPRVRYMWVPLYQAALSPENQVQFFMLMYFINERGSSIYYLDPSSSFLWLLPLLKPQGFPKEWRHWSAFCQLPSSIPTSPKLFHIYTRSHITYIRVWDYKSFTRKFGCVVCDFLQVGCSGRVFAICLLLEMAVLGSDSVALLYLSEAYVVCFLPTGSRPYS